MPVISSAIGAGVCALVVVLAAEWTSARAVALIFGGRIQRFGEPAERVRAADYLDAHHGVPEDAHESQNTQREGALS